MNLDSVHKLSNKTQVLRTQQRQPYELTEGSKATGNYCNSSLPSQRLLPYSSPHPCVHSSNNNDWEISEALRLRELEEVKARAAQMEKTMRWWSDCTANWREKWSKVRAERNKAREEGRQLRIKLETTMKELSELKKLNQNLLSEKEEWETDVTWKKKPSFSEVPSTREKEYPTVCLEPDPVKDVIKFVVQETHTDVEITESSLKKNQGLRFNLRLPDTFAPGMYLERPRQKLENIVHPSENELIPVSALQLQLDESQKILQKEREMHFLLEKEVEKLDSDLSQWKWKYEVTEQSKEESPKLELTDLQQEHNKLNKQYHEKVAELKHANKRVEQHEAEVKKLRIWVEDLKRELNQAETKLDDSLNQIQKLQRSLDEQTEANDNLQVQLNHLKNRVKRQQNESSGSGIKQSSMYDVGDSTETLSKDEGSCVLHKTVLQ